MSNSKSPSAAISPQWRYWLLALVAVIALWVGTDVWRSQGRVPSGIFVGDVNLAGLGWGEAMKVVGDYAKRRRHHTFVLLGDAGSCSLSLDILGASLESARTESDLQHLAARHRAVYGWFRPRESLRPTFAFDPSKLSAWVDSCESRAIKDRPIDGRLVAKDTDFLVQPSRAGRIVDRQRLVGVVGNAIGRIDETALPLPIEERPESPALADLERARQTSIELVSKPLVLRTTEAHLTLLRTDLAKMLDWQRKGDGALGWSLSRQAFDQWLATRRHRVEQRAHDATYKLEGHDKLVVVPEQKGNRIAVDQLFAAVEQGLRDGMRQLDIPFDPTELPKRVVADLDRFNIHEPVGAFTTRHACCQPRVNNIHRIADLINGTIVLPGETYSVNEHVGQRTVENGFVPAPSIEDGEMVDTVGGGVSQFATTFYNAILRAGYEVIERKAHTYWFDRYPMGHEATLSWPKPDIVFRNDTNAGLLILATYTDRTITVRLFGDREGRQVDVSVSQRFDIVRPGIEYLPNAELDPEKEHVKEGGCIGWSVWTMRTVRMKDGTSKQDKRKVVYSPRIRRVEVHPCKVPKGEPGYTGERCPKPEVESDAGDAPSAEAAAEQ